MSAPATKAEAFDLIAQIVIRALERDTADAKRPMVRGSVRSRVTT